jgi:hypothetical protein
MYGDSETEKINNRLIRFSVLGLLIALFSFDFIKSTKKIEFKTTNVSVN